MRPDWSARAFVGLLFACLLAGAPRAPAADQGVDSEGIDPQQQLARMESALRSLDYEGTLVRLAEDRLETLHLVHRILDGRVQERLVSLSGPVRAVTREGGELTCVMPDGHPMFVKGRAGGHLLRPHVFDVAALAPHYRVEPAGIARVAGRDAYVIQLEPRDRLRYGFRFHIDSETGLPLKSDLLDHGGEPLEQLMFTSLTLHDGEEAPSTGTGPVDTPPPASTVADLEVLDARWSFQGRPAGFELSMHDRLIAPDGAAVVHVVFSDQLSAYSLFIESTPAAGLEGVTRVGAVHAAGRRVGPYQVTAVGEVPEETVLTAVRGVHFVQSAAQR
jgi:sigma-E factor negative regulatory protein RseB